MATSLVIKSYLEMPDMSVETRRFVIEPATVEKDGIHDHVHGKVGQTFPVLKDKKFSLFWKDDDEDFVTVSTDEEVRDLLSTVENGTCRLYIKVTGEEAEPMNAPGQDESSASGKGQGTPGDKPDNPMDDTTDTTGPQPDTNDGPFYGPPPPPPPPFFGFHGPHTHGLFGGPLGGPFGGPWGWKRGGGHHHKHGHHHHHRGFGHHGFGHHGFGHHGHHPMHHHGHHPMHHHGGHHAQGAGGHPHPPHWGHPWGVHAGKHSRTDTLRSLVPMPHRRWAKGLIQSWRKENLKNATTTTSDSDGNLDWKISMSDAGVPQAYAEWLEKKLFRWHQKWSNDEISEDRGGCKKMEKKHKKELKASVPKEFRQWTKRYLSTHCGRRDAPNFRRHHDRWNQEMWTEKKNNIFRMVPKEHRMWTKNFIRDWRIEKQIDEANSAIPPSAKHGAEHVDTATEDASQGEGQTVSIPEEYKQWLVIFLTRWHTWRGQLERNPDTPMRGGLGHFKDSVPVDYRGWVKHYLCVHYGKHQKHQHAADTACQELSDVDPSQRKYQVVLQAFQAKWLEKVQAMGGADSGEAVLVSSSSDEEETDKGEPQASFQRLSINTDTGCKKSKVTFDEGSCDRVKAKKQRTQMGDDKTPLVDDSDDFDDDDDNDDMMSQRKTRGMNQDFRRWTKQALLRWDGKTVEGHDNTADDDDDMVVVGGGSELSPNVYRWMERVMMKTQMKKMKQQMKAAKREMKAARKQQKNGMN